MGLRSGVPLALLCVDTIGGTHRLIWVCGWMCGFYFAATRAVIDAQTLLRCTVHLAHPPSPNNSSLTSSVVGAAPLAFHVHAPTDPALLPVSTHQAVAGESLETACQRVWASRIEKQSLQLGGPIARVDVIEASDHTTMTWGVLLTIDHAFCDGQSIGHVCHQLLSAVTNTKIGGAVVPGAGAVWQPAFEVAAGDASTISPDTLKKRMAGARVCDCVGG